MTVKDYIAQLESLPENIPDAFKREMMNVSIWNEEACITYCAMALKNLGATQDEVRKVRQEMKGIMGMMDVEEASMYPWELSWIEP